jgi:hypothetical protein
VPEWLAEKLAAAGESEEETQQRRRDVWANASGWVEDTEALHVVGGDVNRVVSHHQARRGWSSCCAEYDEPGVQHLDAACQAVCESLLWTVLVVWHE